MDYKALARKFYSFDEMLTPSIIHIVFWILVIISVVTGLNTMINAFGYTYHTSMGEIRQSGSFLLFVWGIIEIGIGIILSKIFCELVLVTFKINEHLAEIRKNSAVKLSQDSAVVTQKNLAATSNQKTAKKTKTTQAKNKPKTQKKPEESTKPNKRR